MKNRNVLFPLAALALASVLVPPAKAAEIVTVLAIDPTPTRIYWQFSVHQPADAYRIIIKDTSGAIVLAGTFDPAGTFLGHAHFLAGLTPDTDYTFNIRVRWPSHPGFDAEWVTVPFHTDP